MFVSYRFKQIVESNGYSTIIIHLIYAFLESYPWTSNPNILPTLLLNNFKIFDRAFCRKLLYSYESNIIYQKKGRYMEMDNLDVYYQLQSLSFKISQSTIEQ